MDLAEFLLARIAEDEEAARAAKRGPWFANGRDDEPDWAWEVGTGTGVAGRSEHFPGVNVRGDVVWIGYNGGGTDKPNATHIARWDPARVLAECTLKREIVRLWNETEEGAYGDQGTSVAAEAAYALAAVYSSHPDYRSEWAP